MRAAAVHAASIFYFRLREHLSNLARNPFAQRRLAALRRAVAAPAAPLAFLTAGDPLPESALFALALAPDAVSGCFPGACGAKRVLRAQVVVQTPCKQRTTEATSPFHLATRTCA